MRNTLFGLAAFIAAILGLLVASIVIPRPMTDEQKRELGLYHFDKPRPIAEFNMTDHRGKAVGLASLQGQWSLVFFGFTTCPDICPTSLLDMVVAAEQTAVDEALVFVSIDPARDTPETLAAYTALFENEFPDPVTITLPGGQRPAFSLARHAMTEESAEAAQD